MVDRNLLRVGTLVLAGALGSCSGGGGGGGGGAGSALRVGFTYTASGADEGQLAQVELRLAGGGSLSQPLVVRLVDAGGGDATPGTDVDLSNVTATFPAGSQAGAVAVAAVPVLEDGLIEGADETLYLRMEAVSGNATIDPAARHSLRLVERQRATIEFTAATSTTLDETEGPLNVAVRLSLPPGTLLGTQVSARVFDTFQGDATSGVDYQVFAPTTIVFGPADADGTEATVTVMVLGDSEVEGTEQVRLGIDQPSERAELGTALHEASIVDDEVGGTSQLTATLDDGAVQTGLGGGEQVDLGAQPIGAGPTDGVVLELTNVGLPQLALSVATLSGDTRDFAIELEPASGGLPAVVGSPLVAAGEDPLQGVLLALDEAGLAALEGLERVVLTDLPTPGRRPLALALERLPSPWAEDALLLVDGRPVELAPLLAGSSRWRGAVVGEPGSSAFLAFSRHGSHGWIQRADGALLHLVSERGDAFAAARSRLITNELLENQIVRPLALECAGALPTGSPRTAELGQTPSVDDCRLAIETDFQLHQVFGSEAALVNYVTALVAAVGAQYRLDVQAELTMSYLGVYTTENDPWTSQDGGGSTIGLLNEFQDAWNQSGWPVPAQLAHFLSGADLGGGVAYVDVLCDGFYGFGVSANIDGAIDWQNFDGSPSALSWDFVVFAHELGHNFGSDHTHDYCPPLDACTTNCAGGTVCTPSTIMSYCHLCGGMGNIRLEFHPHTANEMRLAVDASCFGGTGLASGDSTRLRIRFEPTSAGAGARQATLRFTHDGDNLPSPFELQLGGTATD